MSCPRRMIPTGAVLSVSLIQSFRGIEREGLLLSPGPCGVDHRSALFEQKLLYLIYSYLFAIAVFLCKLKTPLIQLDPAFNHSSCVCCNFPSLTSPPLLSSPRITLEFSRLLPESSPATTVISSLTSHIVILYPHPNPKARRQTSRLTFPSPFSACSQCFFLFPPRFSSPTTNIDFHRLPDIRCLGYNSIFLAFNSFLFDSTLFFNRIPLLVLKPTSRFASTWYSQVFATFLSIPYFPMLTTSLCSPFTTTSLPSSFATAVNLWCTF